MVWKIYVICSVIIVIILGVAAYTRVVSLGTAGSIFGIFLIGGFVMSQRVLNKERASYDQ